MSEAQEPNDGKRKSDVGEARAENGKSAKKNIKDEEDIFDIDKVLASITKNDVVSLRKLLSREDLSKLCGHKRDFLFEKAVELAGKNCVEYLLAIGMDVDTNIYRPVIVEDDDNDSLYDYSDEEAVAIVFDEILILFLAMEMNNRECASLLIEKGARMTNTTTQKETMKAICNVDKLLAIISKNDVVGLRNSLSRDDLSKLCGHNRDRLFEKVTEFAGTDCVVYLLSIGVDVNTSVYHRARIHLSSDDEDTPCSPNNNSNFEFYEVPILLLAVKFGNLECVEVLIQKGGQMAFAKSKHYNCPLNSLYFAARAGKLELVKILLKNGCPVDHLSTNGSEVHSMGYRFENREKNENIVTTPMFVATMNGHCSIMKVLAKAGADLHVSSVQLSNTTLFEIACEYGGLDAVKLLVKLGATPKVNPVRLEGNDDGELYSSEVFNFLSTIECDTDLTDESFLKAAIDCKRLDLVEEFIKRGGDVNKSPHLTAIVGIREVEDPFILPFVKYLLDNGADINAISNGWDKSTALMIAAYKKNSAVVSYLLDNGAALTLADYYGNTALLLAAQVGDILSLIALLDHGADVNVINKHGETFLMLAQSSGNVECVKLIEDYLQGLGKVFLK